MFLSQVLQKPIHYKKHIKKTSCFLFFPINILSILTYQTIVMSRTGASHWDIGTYEYLFYGNRRRVCQILALMTTLRQTRGEYIEKKKFLTLLPSDRFRSNLSANTRLAICEISRGAYNERVVINLSRQGEKSPVVSRERNHTHDYASCARAYARTYARHETARRLTKYLYTSIITHGEAFAV